MFPHVTKELLGHGSIGFYTGMEGGIGDNSWPDAVNNCKAVRRENRAGYVVAPVGFPRTDNSLGLDVHTVDAGDGRFLGVLMDSNPGTDNARTTGKIQ